VPLYLAVVGYGALVAILDGAWLLYLIFSVDYTRWDLLAIYIGPRAFVTGHGGGLYDISLQQQIAAAVVSPQPLTILVPYIFPGYDALLLAPLGLVSYSTAYVAWAALNVLLAGGTLVVLARAYAPPGLERLALFLAGAGFTPLLFTILQGQPGVFTLLALTGTTLALRAGYERTAGAWLWLGLFKPQLIAFSVLSLLLAARRRALLVFAGGSLALLLVSLIVLGNWVPGWLTILTQLQDSPGVAGSDHPAVMQNWRGAVYALLYTTTTPLASVLITGLSGVSVLLALAVGWPRPRFGPASGEVRFAVITLLGLLIIPHMYLHDDIIALVPGYILWQASGQALQTDSPPPAAGRLHLLRWLLGLGPLVALLAEFWWPPVVRIWPWYLAVVIAVALWGWSAFAPAPDTPAAPPTPTR
jgi:hypothetical protein